MTIFLTAGHHEKDSGAVNRQLKLKESDLNLELVRLSITRAKQICPKINIWTDDYKDNLSTVISKIKSKATKDDVLIEIHFDSADSATAKGTTSIVSNNARQRSINIAKSLSHAVSTVLDTTDRGVKDESKSNRGKLGILHTAASSVLLEVEFMSNNEAISNYEKWKHWVSEEIAYILVDIYEGRL